MLCRSSLLPQLGPNLSTSTNTLHPPPLRHLSLGVSLQIWEQFRQHGWPPCCLPKSHIIIYPHNTPLFGSQYIMNENFSNRLHKYIFHKHTTYQIVLPFRVICCCCFNTVLKVCKWANVVLCLLKIRKALLICLLPDSVILLNQKYRRTVLPSPQVSDLQLDSLQHMWKTCANRRFSILCTTYV